MPAEWIAKYEGKFDGGWDEYREETLARQIEAGRGASGHRVAPKPEDIPDWETLSADEQSYTPARWRSSPRSPSTRTTRSDVWSVLSRRWARWTTRSSSTSSVTTAPALKEAWPERSTKTIVLNGLPDPVEDQLEYLDDWGGPTSYPHFHAGLGACLQHTVPVDQAGGLALRRHPEPAGRPLARRHRGEAAKIRSQWHHVTDIAPTVMEAAGLPFPNRSTAPQQKPIRRREPGLLLRRCPNAKDRTRSQYFEMFGNRAIYHDGWVAATKHRTPWAAAPDGPLEQDTWELYNVAEDFSQANDLAASDPKLQEMQDALLGPKPSSTTSSPSTTASSSVFNAAIAGRPDVMGDRTSLTVYEGMPA